MSRKHPTPEEIAKWYFSDERLDASVRLEYELALGRLTIAWADVEAELYQVLKAYANVDKNIARVVFTGLRAQTMIEKIKLIASNTDMEAERVKDLQFVFAQISAINTMRDRIIHGSTSSHMFPKDDPQSRVITNYGRSANRDKYYEHVVGAGDIYLMIYDLMGICNHLNQHWGSIAGNRPFSPWQENPGEHTTWLYKSPKPIKRKDKSRDNPQKLTNPPQPSRE